LWQIIDRHTVDVDGKRYTTKHILIGTGGRIWVPPIPGAEHVITSDDALDLTSVPSRIAIVGGGYIALEFAGIFNSAGAQVDIFVRGDKLLRGFDDEVQRGGPAVCGWNTADLE
jgi:glutathione reductase (NADPH)